MVRSFSHTSFPLNISWWQLKSHFFCTSSRIPYIFVSKEQFPIWNVKNYWNWTEHLAKSHCCWWCQPQPTQCQLTRTINFSTSTPCQCTFCNSQIQLKILGIFSKPLLLYNCKHITGECKLFPTPLLDRNSLISNETVPKLETLTWDGCKLLSWYSRGGHQ